MGFVKDEEALSGGRMPKASRRGGDASFCDGARSVIERAAAVVDEKDVPEGGVTPSEIKQLNELIEVKIFEWNTEGLLTRIEVIYTLKKLLFWKVLFAKFIHMEHKLG